MDQDSIVAIFDTHADAERAVNALQRGNFNMKQLSIVGKDYHTEEHVVGYYNASNRMMYWGKFGAFWGGLWGLLFGAAFFWVPSVGPLLVGGPLVAAIVGGLEGAAVVGGVTAIGAGLYSLGIPKDSVLKYETELRSDRFLLVAHGTREEVNHAREILAGVPARSTETHHKQPAEQPA
jgi:uncharacterized membrane protein